jgi:hypothetical protein
MYVVLLPSFKDEVTTSIITRSVWRSSSTPACGFSLRVHRPVVSHICSHVEVRGTKRRVCGPDRRA